MARSIPHALVLSLLISSIVGVPAYAQQRSGSRTPHPTSPAPNADSASDAPSASTAPKRAGESSDNAGPAADSSPEPGTQAAPTPAPAASSEPNTAPAQSAETETAPTPPPQAALQKQLSSVMDALVQARARVAVLGKSLWKTTVAIKVDDRAIEDQDAVRLQLWLDGAPVWSGDGSGLKDPERTLFSGFLAPGQHVFTYEVEQRARSDDKYRYTQRASHRFTALKKRRTELRLVLDDDSDIADDFRDDEEGEYDVRVQLQVRAVAPGDE